jgi:hypothetical protein
MAAPELTYKIAVNPVEKALFLGDSSKNSEKSIYIYPTRFAVNIEGPDRP